MWRGSEFHMQLQLKFAFTSSILEQKNNVVGFLCLCISYKRCCREKDIYYKNIYNKQAENKSLSLISVQTIKFSLGWLKFFFHLWHPFLKYIFLWLTREFNHRTWIILRYDMYFSLFDTKFSWLCSFEHWTIHFKMSNMTLTFKNWLLKETTLNFIRFSYGFVFLSNLKCEWFFSILLSSQELFVAKKVIGISHFW